MQKYKLAILLIITLLAGVIIGMLISKRDTVSKQQYTTADSLIVLQSTMIDELANHMWNEHDCELPQMDSDLLDSIHILEYKMNSYEAIK